MVIKTFDEIVQMAAKQQIAGRVVVAAAADKHTLEAVCDATKDGLTSPVLVGDKVAILKILEKLDMKIPEADIYDVPAPEAAAAKAVELIRERKGDFLMKGKLETAQMLRPVVNKQTGIGKGGLMSHFTLFEAPNYHKLFAVVDGGMVMYPDLEQKVSILENTVDIFQKLGYKMCKAAALAAIEKVNPKMPETVEASQLPVRAQERGLRGCVIEGPVSLDIAMNREAAKVKGYAGAVGGDADILIVPNIHVGNALGKSIYVIAGGKMAGFIVGAQVPIILTSRSSSAEEKYLSIALASVVSGK